ncbi:fungal-specific transcription factor domain-containing protein [Chaetomium tenue]|uniref:Fungal-specific transcription factor domain-containing protein n=1 Tax=Chaetomium tenue TaxID=1854479 RepID=A0ACB7P277_9PEZI|nr:fungal-specific transcription factor domain-containing protein [Chaetomium globosum]
MSEHGQRSEHTTPDPSTPNPIVPIITAIERPERTERPERPQCWECRRRRLVCDGVQPVCTKCRAAAIVCPGYADKKPLTWLAPGQVMSRTRRKKNPSTKVPNSKAPPPRKACHSAKRRLEKKGPAVASDSSEDSRSDTQEEMVEFPLPVEIRPEVCDIFEAMLYYNGHIYPQLEESQLAPSGFLFPIVLVQDIPPSIVHTLVSVVVGHRITQMVDDPTTSQVVKPMWTRLYRHRDIAVREITKLVANEATRKNITTLVAVYSLLFAMLQQSSTPGWRTHVDAYMSLLHLRGSFEDVIRDIPYIELSMMALFIVSVFANTTSPNNNQLQITSTDGTLRLASTYYTETYYPSINCPTPLFTSIILINDLRTHLPSPETTRAAHLLLARIETFSPTAFSADKDAFEDEWQLLGAIYRATTALYAILSLQSSGALPRSSAELGLARARHARQLFGLLERAVEVPRVRKRTTWALIVAGVEAARAGAGVQRWIGERLDDMSRDHGVAGPRVARATLERFWAKGGGSWDECFPEPCCFLM